MRAYRLIQEDYRGDPWKILVCAILVNRARGNFAKGIAKRLFAIYPTPEALMERASMGILLHLLKPLGFMTSRAANIVMMTEGLLELEDKSDLDAVRRLAGIGPYAIESYRIFVLNQTDFIPNDTVLRHYLNRSSK